MSLNRAYTKLQLSIKDIVYDGVPLNLYCNNCKTELDLDNIIDKSTDTGQWDRMVGNIISTVVESLPDILNEVA